MIETKVAPAESLQAARIEELAASSGPCITLYLPPYRPGAQAQSMAAMLKTGVQEAVRRLHLLKTSDALIQDLVEPLQRLGQQDDFLAGSHWAHVIFRSPEGLWHFQAIEPSSQGVTVGGCFEIRSLLAELHLPREFYVLKLSKKRVALLRCSQLQLEPVEFPKGTPTTLEEATAFKQPDHDLENRSTSGSSPSGLRKVRFGTGSARETQQTYLADFYRAVDKGIATLLHGTPAPLILAGVREDASIYRIINTHPALLVLGIQGSPGAALADADLLRQAYAIVRNDCIDKASAALAEAREEVSPARFSLKLSEILPAAADGRVSRLYVDEFARRFGVAPNLKHDGRSNWGEEDLLNLAAVQTVRHGGSAYSLPSSKMLEGAPIAAIYRY